MPTRETSLRPSIILRPTKSIQELLRYKVCFSGRKGLRGHRKQRAPGKALPLQPEKPLWTHSGWLCLALPCPTLQSSAWSMWAWTVCWYWGFKGNPCPQLVSERKNISPRDWILDFAPERACTTGTRTQETVFLHFLLL